MLAQGARALHGCGSRPFPGLELVWFISQCDGCWVSAALVPVLEPAKNYLKTHGGEAKSTPFPVTDNVHFWGAPDFEVLPCSREGAGLFSCSSSLSSSPSSAFSQPFNLLFLAAQ